MKKAFAAMFISMIAFGEARTHLKEVIQQNQHLIRGLASKGANGEFLTAEQDIVKLKGTLAQALKLSPENVAILADPRNGSGWFGKVVILVDKKAESFYIVDHEGDWITKKINSKMFGGIVTEKTGAETLLTGFYGDITKGDLCDIYWGATKASVLNFKFDRDKGGSIDAKVRLPNGIVARLTRKGSDNKELRINGHRIIPLFE